MYINTDTIFSMTQANQNFSSVARTVDSKGEAVVFKNNKPKYLIVDMESNDLMLDLTDDEKIDIVNWRKSLYFQRTVEIKGSVTACGCFISTVQ